ncbi:MULTISPECIES: GNAT family N-acetyltransferase [Brevundimonas]|uniref:GNAT family N-acetyltransferase n=1 Tax=Brevundimonas mediterranea TaxID=74329 RepID=A0AB37E4Q5_9CAUL|nr:MULTISPECIES: GNAT family N-acetyltransferase [Brevundimonas]MDZ4322376.1 GNAT family N-acetyltransferase [Phenylobacterium sp.]OGN47297.1 MAG: GNAT family N-acetyltransferase [Caulobacterales bacterium RIFCSPHIGHO2_12_FULL_68_13]EDX79673.1 acetyltransferase, GNAT family [Brevundimonas sp. BAL3]MBA4331847.1 N-acetyltransferase [Brevundimonas sp.]QIH72159.1 GNAT family N-acetyltransferase [Brevundimonas mediterranea]
MSDFVFRAATLADVATLHPLIERAYRGETAKAGWTHEADLLFDTRTSAEELSALIADPDRVILLAHKDGALIGCVQVARVGDDRTYLGMLTVEPTLQASGLGRRLLAAAETEAVARFAARRMEMTVIHRRAELIAWYQRRGYAPTGETRPFPVDPPRPELEFVVLEKGL